MSVPIFTHVSECEALAKKIAPTLKGGEILGLIGPLGAGKTTFTQSLAKALGVKQVLRSPTFILMQSVKIPRKKFSLHHLDLYRLENLKEINALGMEDFLGKKNSVTVIEWADRAKSTLPKKTKYIHFQTSSL